MVLLPATTNKTNDEAPNENKGQHLAAQMEKAHVASLIEEMEALGFVCTAKEKYTRELAAQISSRLVPRAGEAVYQSAKITLVGFPRRAIDLILGDTKVKSTEQGGTKIWDFQWNEEDLLELALALLVSMQK